MICKKCGENLPDNARECFTCGAKVQREVTELDESGKVIKTAKKEITAGQLFHELFKNGTFFMLSVLMAVMTVFSVAVFGLSFATSGWDEIVTNGINVAAQCFITVVMFKLYKIADSEKASDYKQSFKMLNIYCGVRIGIRVLSVALTAIAVTLGLVLAGSGVIVAIFNAALSAAIYILPDIVAFKFTDSLYRSAVNDRIKLTETGFLRILLLIYGIIQAFGSFVLFVGMFSALAEKPIVIAATAIAGVVAIISTAMTFMAHEWFRNLKLKTEWM